VERENELFRVRKRESFTQRREKRRKAARHCFTGKRSRRRGEKGLLCLQSKGGSEPLIMKMNCRCPDGDARASGESLAREKRIASLSLLDFFVADLKQNDPAPNWMGRAAAARATKSRTLRHADRTQLGGVKERPWGGGRDSPAHGGRSIGSTRKGKLYVQRAGQGKSKACASRKKKATPCKKKLVLSKKVKKIVFFKKSAKPKNRKKKETPKK